jgi:hypothetical protein
VGFLDDRFRDRFRHDRGLRRWSGHFVFYKEKKEGEIHALMM